MAGRTQAGVMALGVSALALAGWALTGWWVSPKATASDTPVSLAPPRPLSTSTEGLEAAVATARARLGAHPKDVGAAATLADAAVRLARVRGIGAPLREAESALDAIIEADPVSYDARRARALVYLSQHRFEQARLEAERCRALRGDASWIDGVVGDASLELGDLDQAIQAFDRMLAARPDAAGYARASYARELQGDIRGAMALMRMADSATSAHDPEAQAWNAAHIGHLHLALGEPQAAALQYVRADLAFPGHPLARQGLARVDLARGLPQAALDRLAASLLEAPSADEFAIAGDALIRLGRAQEAERHYQMAESLWMSDTPDPGALARFRAARGRRASMEGAAR